MGPGKSHFPLIVLQCSSHAANFEAIELLSLLVASPRAIRSESSSCRRYSVKFDGPIGICARFTVESTVLHTNGLSSLSFPFFLLQSAWPSYRMRCILCNLRHFELQQQRRDLDLFKVVVIKLCQLLWNMVNNLVFEQDRQFYSTCVEIFVNCLLKLWGITPFMLLPKVKERHLTSLSFFFSFLAL
jgi:hypothetical protein